MTITVQYTQYGVTEVEDYTSEVEAMARYVELCAERATTEAWVFDGPTQEAHAIEQYRRPVAE